MRAVFKRKLDHSEVEEIEKFCSSAHYFAIEQSFGFPEILGASNITYFYLTDEKTIFSFSQINENFRFAHIWFGPVCNDGDLMIESVLLIAEYYKNRRFWYLGIQPYFKTGPAADYIEYTLSRHLRITYVFSSEYTKSSMEIDLFESSERIWSNFRKGHKSAIRKAVNLGISVTEQANKVELEAFIRVYLDMCNDRGIKGHTEKEIAGICRYVIEHKCGEIILAKNHESEVIGGAIFTHQGISVRYLLSAADPGRKDIPVTHLILLRAIERSREAGFQYFDFWGYNHFADPDDQIFMVNRFKKGFGGYFTFFMKRLNISLIPGGYILYGLYNKIRQSKSTRKLYSRLKRNMENSHFA